MPITVKKAAGTTISLIALFVGIVYFSPIIKNMLPSEVFYTLNGRLYPQYSLGSFYPFIVKTAIIIIIAVGILNAIMRNKVAFGLLSSFSIPIIMSIPVIFTAFNPQVNFYMFWAILQIAVIIST